MKGILTSRLPSNVPLRKVMTNQEAAEMSKVSGYKWQVGMEYVLADDLRRANGLLAR